MVVLVTFRLILLSTSFFRNFSPYFRAVHIVWVVWHCRGVSVIKLRLSPARYLISRRFYSREYVLYNIYGCAFTSPASTNIAHISLKSLELIEFVRWKFQFRNSKSGIVFVLPLLAPFQCDWNLLGYPQRLKSSLPLGKLQNSNCIRKRSINISINFWSFR